MNDPITPRRRAALTIMPELGELREWLAGMAPGAAQQSSEVDRTMGPAVAAEGIAP